jgi:glycosyltransferase involved in cell wall biosynthesis
MSRHRILYLINDLALGGAQRVLASQATGLERACFAPEVASLELIPDGPIGREIEAAGIPVHRLLEPGETAPQALPRLVGLMRRERFDLVHAHLAAADVSASLASCLVDVPALVTTFHNLRDWEERADGPLRWVERRTLSLCDRVIVVSDAVGKAMLRRLPDLRERTVLIRNGVDLERVHGAGGRRDLAREAFGIPRDAFVVGAVARLDRSKGLDILLEAAAQTTREVRELRLLLAGDGPERPRLEELADDLGLRPRTVFTGPAADVRDALGALDLFVAPSRTEGLGLALLEAQGAGVAVLGARVGGIPEVVEHEVAGELVDSHEPSDWARRIAALARDRGRLAAYAAAGPSRAARFSLPKSVAALERLYLELLEPASRLDEAA